MLQRKTPLKSKGPMKQRSKKKAAKTTKDKEVKATVRREQNYQCQVCGREAYEEHHIVYESQGGLTIKRNLITLCEHCHHARIHDGDGVLDKKLKLQLQAKLMEIFTQDREYTTGEIAAAIEAPERIIENAVWKGSMKSQRHQGEYKSSGEQVVRWLMGGQIYAA